MCLLFTYEVVRVCYGSDKHVSASFSTTFILFSSSGLGLMVQSNVGMTVRKKTSATSSKPDIACPRTRCSLPDNDLFANDAMCLGSFILALRHTISSPYDEHCNMPIVAYHQMASPELSTEEHNIYIGERQWDPLPGLVQDVSCSHPGLRWTVCPCVDRICFCSR